jgi:hypothetical protein
MNTFTFPDGIQVDLESGNIIGQQPAQPIVAGDITKREALNVERSDKGAGRQALDVIKQLTWGLNSALFALPDAVVEQVGKAAGVDEKEIPTFTKYFNAGQVAPENMLERFALTIGKGAGAGLPLTGLLGYLSTTKTLAGPLSANAGALKRAAKDMLDYIRKDPAGAVKADIAFGGIYGGVEQAVEEFMDPGQGKDLTKAVLPTASILAVPTILNVANKVMQISPTGQAIKAVAGQTAPTDFSRDEIVQMMVGEKTPKIPGLNWALGKAAAYNERQAGERVAKILEPLSDPAKVNVQESIRITRELEDFIANDPRLKDLGLSDRFLLDLAQTSLDGSVLAARNEIVKNLSGAPLTTEQVRQADLENVFLRTFQTLAPKSPMAIEDALRAAYADHMNTVATATKQIKTATEDEALMFADRFKAANLDDLGAWLRSSVMAQSEGVFYKLRQEAEAIGARQAVSPENRLLPTRAKGKALTIYPRTDFEEFSRNLVGKYKLTSNNRFFVNEAVPAPIQYIASLIKRNDDQINKEIEKSLDGVIDSFYLTLLKNQAKSPNKSDNDKSNMILKMYQANPEYLRNPTFGVSKLLGQLKQSILGKATPEVEANVLAQLNLPPSGLSNELKQELLKEAREKAVQSFPFEITKPEALDMLEASLRYRNAAISEYNKRMDFGIRRNSAQRVLDTANNIHKDIEDFVMNSFGKDPALAKWLDKYEDVFRKGYEKTLPLLISRRRGTEDFLLSSERVVGEALKSADNIRSLNVILGRDNAKYQEALLDAMYDKAYRSNVLDQDGILDPKKYNRFLQSNRNLIEAMPDKVQRTLMDEASVADGSIKRLADLRTRAEDVADTELVNTLKKAVRQDADPQKLVLQAVDDPAVMRKLVDSLGNQPGQLEALRRQVWLGVEKELFNPQNPLFMEEFLKRNSKSLNILYTPQHLDDLRQLAEMQKRVFAGVGVEGKLSPFMSFDEKLRATVGVSVGTAEATLRAATIRQISTMHAGVSLLTRLATRQQTNAYEAVLYRALTDSKYAHTLVNATAPPDSAKGLAQQVKLAAKAGVSLPKMVRIGQVYLPPAAKVAGIEGVQALEDETRPIPVRPPEFTSAPATMPQTPQAARRVPSPPSVPAPNPSLAQSGPARSLPKMPAQPNEAQYSEFARLFPNDFVAPLMPLQRYPQP